MSRFLNALRPLVRIMPEVKAPDRKVSFREKFAWTAIILILYLIMSELPLYGVKQGTGYDYFFWMRLILASSRGTLMELGIGPIVTAGLVMQLLVGSQLIRVDMSDPLERSLYTGGQKVLAVFMTAFQAIAYVAAGAYGTLRLDQAVLVFLQLMFAGVVVILMDEMIQKGWGLGSGVSLFIMANVFTQIVWNLFSLAPAQAPDVPGMMMAPPNQTQNFVWYLGVVPFILQNLSGIGAGGIPGVTACLPQWIWFRPANPRASLFGVFITFLVFLLVIYMESFRVNIPLQYAKYRGFRGQYPIKLLYVSNIPVIFAQALYANILFITQVLWNAWAIGGANAGTPLAFWFRLFAMYKLPETTGSTSAYLIPQPFSFVWFLTAPVGIFGTGGLLDTSYAAMGMPWLGLLRATGYALLLMALCAGFARLWIDVSGIAPRDVSRQLIDAGMQVPGFRRTTGVIEKILERYIPVVAVVGGILIGALAAFADFAGALSTGVGILLAVGIAKQYMEILAKEQLGEMNPALAGLLGTG
jgi:preprotein translocase SecY subunit